MINYISGLAPTSIRIKITIKIVPDISSALSENRCTLRSQRHEAFGQLNYFSRQRPVGGDRQ